MSSRLRLLFLAAAIAATLSASVASSDAATMTLDPDGTLEIVATPGVNNYVFVETFTNNAFEQIVYVIAPAAYGKQAETLDASPPCSSYGPDSKSCPADQVSRVRVYAGDGDDYVVASNRRGARIPIEVLAGSGRDRVGVNRDCVDCSGDGGEGNDRIEVCACNVSAFGGPGNDTIDSGSFSVPPDTGALGTVLNGGTGNDHIDGTPFSDTIDGDAGNDWIRGGAYADVLGGGEGKDRIYAADGKASDWVYCGTNLDGAKEGDIATIDGTPSGPSDINANCERLHLKRPKI